MKVEEQISQRETPIEIKHALYKEFHRLPLEMNKIVCSNFHGKGYGCNPKYIVKELLNLSEDLDIVWLVNKDYKLPAGIRSVKFNSKEAFREIATARVLIDNQLKFSGFLKRKDQFYINTWHGAIPLKKIGYDNPDNVGSKKYKERAKMNFSHIDLMPSNSQFCTDMLRRTFRYKGLVLEKGCPRNDLFFASRTTFLNKVRKKFSIPEDKKILLYAPTFRKDKALDTYQLEYQSLLNHLGDDWIILIRLHPHLQKKSNQLVEYTDQIINASAYADMQELMAAADILVTDYSNIMFEFMLTGRPCLLYATDIEEYRKDRDYYFDIYNLPFPITTTTPQLADAILQFDTQKYMANCDAFRKQVGLCETGTASKEIATLILGMTANPKFKLKKELRHMGKYSDC